MLSDTRAYLKLERTRFLWITSIHATSLSFESCPKHISEFYLLNDLYGGTDGCVWLACAIIDKIVRLVVIKFPHESDIAQEVHHWNTMDIESVYSTVLNNKNAIIMPVAFHYKSDGTIDTEWWGTKHQSEVPIHNFEVFYELALQADPIEVLNQCMLECSKVNLVHKDIHWRHVAMFPVIGGDSLNPSYTLNYRFIDLTRMTTVNSSQEAMDRMKNDYDELIWKLNENRSTNFV